MSSTAELLAFNRGIISRLGLARLDLKRTAMSAQEQTNWMPRALGSMMLRPGLQYMATLLGLTRTIPFMFAVDDIADIEMSNGIMRVRVDDALVTRPTVIATITNGGFDASLASWTDQDEAGATSAFVAGGYMGLTGDGTNHAIRQQLVAVTAPYYGLAHAIRVTVTRGPVVMRVGSTSLGSEYLSDTTLGTGTHSIVVLPSASFYLQFRSRLNRQVLVDSVSIESNVALSLPTPYDEDDLPMLRWDQSGDVIYLACAGKQQRKLERRANGSWSIVTYQPEDGPFRVENVGPTTIAASALSGSGVTLTASASLFRSGHVGALFSITSAGQRIETDFSADNVFSDPIRVIGVGETRRFAIVLTGTWVATVTLQRSIGDVGSWQDITTYGANIDTTYIDALDNQIIYYRIGIKAGDYTSGTVESVVNYSSGSITGVVRITAQASDVSATADILSALGGTAATDIWAEGQWSDLRGWPSAVTLHDGRLQWAGKDRFLGSITDGFESFDPNYPGDAGTISKSIGSGPVDSINWLMSLNRLFAGADAAIVECKSSSLDEPLTPQNFTPKRPVTKGTARIAAVKVDATAIVVQRSGVRVNELDFDVTRNTAALSDLTLLCPEVCEPGIVVMAVQREPDTRIHCVLSDGTVAVLLFDRAENLICWVKVTTNGEVVDAVVQPGSIEDTVSYTVKRTIGGVDVYYKEKWALESEARGGATNKMADSFVYYSGVSTTTITGLGHLEGEEVIAWGNGIDLSSGVGDDQVTYTVTGGQITLPQAVTTACVGLPYSSRYKSSKLAYLVPPGKSGLGAKKKIEMLGLVMADVHAKGIEYGQDFDAMDPLPEVEDGAEVDQDTVHEDFEHSLMEFDGEWKTDVRLCLRGTAPRPCTVLAAVIDMQTHPK